MNSDIFSTRWSRLIGIEQDAALKLVFLHYSDYLLRYARLKWRICREDAEDLVSAFKVKSANDPKFLNDLRPERGRFRNLLKRKLRDAAADEFRKKTAQKRAAVFSDVDWETIAEEELDIDVAVDGEYAAKFFNRALTELSAGRDPEVLEVLRPSIEDDKFDCAEAAALLGIKVNNVYQRRSELRRSYRRILSEHLDRQEPGLTDAEKLLEIAHLRRLHARIYPTG